jgi:hypothetical protein
MDKSSSNMKLDDTLPSECVPWTEGYSLEFLLGLEIFHEHYGTGTVYAVDDELVSCCVCFKGVIHIELSALNFKGLKKPWHINTKRIDESFAEYQASIDKLQKDLETAKQTVEDLQLKPRWGDILKVILAPSDVAIVLTDEDSPTIH